MCVVSDSCVFGCIVQDETLGPDPFYDLEQHALLGVANFFLECLHHGIKHEYSAPIVAPTGKVFVVVMPYGELLCIFQYYHHFRNVDD